MSKQTILASAANITSNYLPRYNGTGYVDSVLYDNGTNIGINTVSPVATNLVGALTIVKSYEGDTPTSTTAQTYNVNQSNLYLFGRNAGLTMVGNNGEEAIIAFANASAYYIGGIRYDMGTTSAGGAMKFQTGGANERMRITNGGVVQINTTVGGATLNLKAQSGGNAIRLQNAAGGDGTIFAYGDATSIDYVFNTYSVGNAITLKNNGNFIIGSSTDIGSRLYVQGGGGQGAGWIQQDSAPPLYLNRTGNDGGEVIFLKAGTQVGSINTNSYSLPSDANFKKNIKTLDLGLNLVSKLRSVSYNHKIDDEGSALSTGFIAQELEQALTELGVEQNKYHILQHIPNEKEGESQYWLDYSKLIPVLTKAIQELSQKVTDQQQQINQLINK